MIARKRILVLTSTFPRWQGDKEPPFVYELSRRLAERYEVMVLAPHTPGAKRKEQFGKLEVYRFKYFFDAMQGLAYQGGIMANLKQNPSRYMLIPFFLLSELVCLVGLVRKHKIDLIHAHWTVPQGLVAIIARAMVARDKPAILCTSHGTDLLGLNGNGWRWIQNKVIRGVDKLTVVSEVLSMRARDMSGRRDIRIIPMGVDLEQGFAPDGESIRRSQEILFVGRLTETKGVQYLIEAMPAVMHRHAGVQLTIIGDGPQRESLEGMAERLGIGKDVRFLGAVENAALKQFYREATLMVSPSLSEGFGLTLVEAMGCACPVLATDLPATREIVTDGVTGILCKPEDSEAMADKIGFMLAHPAFCMNMANAARQYVLSRFDWVNITHQYMSTIDDLVRGRQ